METGAVIIEEPVTTKTHVEEVLAGVKLDQSFMELEKKNLSTSLDDEITSHKHSEITEVVLNGSENKEDERGEATKAVSVAEESKTSETDKDEPENFDTNKEDVKILLSDATLGKEKEDDITQKPEKACEEILIKTDEVKDGKDSRTVETSVNGIESTISVEEISRNIENQTVPEEETARYDESLNDVATTKSIEVEEGKEEMKIDAEQSSNATEKLETETVKTVIEDPKIVNNEETIVLESESLTENAEPSLNVIEKGEAETVKTTIEDSKIVNNEETTVHESESLKENLEPEEAIRNSDDAEPSLNVIEKVETETVKIAVEDLKLVNSEETTVLESESLKASEEPKETIRNSEDAEPSLNVIEEGEAETVKTAIEDLKIINNEETTVHESESSKIHEGPVEAISNSEEAEQISSEVIADREKEEAKTQKPEEVQDSPSTIEIPTVHGEDMESKVSVELKEEVEQCSKDIEKHEHVLGRDIPQCESLEGEAVDTSTVKEATLLKSLETNINETKTMHNATGGEENEETEMVKTIISSDEVSSSDAQAKVLGEHNETCSSEIEDESHGKQDESTEEKHENVLVVPSAESEKYQCNEPETDLVANTESSERSEELPSHLVLKVDKEDLKDEKIKVNQVDEAQTTEEQRSQNSNEPEAEQNRTDETEKNPIEITVGQVEQTRDIEPSFIEKSSMDQTLPVEQVKEACFRGDQQMEETETNSESLHDDETTARVLEVAKEEEETEIISNEDGEKIESEETGDKEKEEDITQKTEEMQESPSVIETLTTQREEIESKASLVVKEESDQSSKDTEEHEHELGRDITQCETLKPEAVDTSTVQEAAILKTLETEDKETRSSDQVDAQVEEFDEHTGPCSSEITDESKGREESFEVKSKETVQDERSEEKDVNVLDVQYGESEKYQDNKPEISLVSETESLEEIPSDLALNVDKFDGTQTKEEPRGLELNDPETKIIEQNVTDVTEEIFVDVESVEKMQTSSIESPELSRNTSKPVDEKIGENEKQTLTVHQEGQEEGSNGLETKEEVVSVPDSSELQAKAHEEESCLPNEEGKEIKLHKEQIEKHEPTKEEKSDEFIQISSAPPSEDREGETVVEDEKIEDIKESEEEEEVTDKIKRSLESVGIVETHSSLPSFSEEQHHGTVVAAEKMEDIKVNEEEEEVTEKIKRSMESVGIVETHNSLPSSSEEQHHGTVVAAGKIEDIKVNEEEEEEEVTEKIKRSLESVEIVEPHSSLPSSSEEKHHETVAEAKEIEDLKENEEEEEEVTEKIKRSLESVEIVEPHSSLPSSSEEQHHGSVAEAKKTEDEKVTGDVSEKGLEITETTHLSPPFLDQKKEIIAGDEEYHISSVASPLDDQEKVTPTENGETKEKESEDDKVDSYTSPMLSEKNDNETLLEAPKLEEPKEDKSEDISETSQFLSTEKSPSSELVSELDDQITREVEGIHEEEKAHASEVAVDQFIQVETSQANETTSLVSVQDYQIPKEVEETHEEETKEDHKLHEEEIIPTEAVPSLEVSKQEKSQETIETTEATEGTGDETPKQVEEIHEETNEEETKEAHKLHEEEIIPTEVVPNLEVPKQEKSQETIDTTEAKKASGDQTTKQAEEIHEDETMEVQKLQEEEILPTKTVPKESFDDAPVTILASGEQEQVTLKEGNSVDEVRETDEAQEKRYVSADAEESAAEIKPIELEAEGTEKSDDQAETSSYTLSLERAIEVTKVEESEAPKLEESKEVKSPYIQEITEEIKARGDQTLPIETSTADQTLSSELVSRVDDQIPRQSEEIREEETKEEHKLSSDLASELDDQTPRQAEEIHEEETKEEHKFEATRDQSLPVETSQEYQIMSSDLASGLDGQTPKQVEEIHEEEEEKEAHKSQVADDQSLLAETSQADQTASLVLEQENQTPENVNEIHEEETHEAHNLQVETDHILPVETSNEDQTPSLVSEHDDQTPKQVEKIDEEETKETHKLQVEEIPPTETFPTETFTEAPVSILASREDEPVTLQEGQCAGDIQEERHVSAETEPKESDDQVETSTNPTKVDDANTKKTDIEVAETNAPENACRKQELKETGTLLHDAVTEDQVPLRNDKQDYHTGEAEHGDETISNLPVVGILEGLHTTLETERTTNESASLGENIMIEQAEIVQRTSDAKVELNEEDSAADVVEANRLQQDESKETVNIQEEKSLAEKSLPREELNLQDEDKEEVKAQDGISREFEVSVEKKLQENEIKEIAEKQEEHKAQQDVNASTEEKISLQEEQQPRDFEISKTVEDNSDQVMELPEDQTQTEQKPEINESVKEEDQIVDFKEVQDEKLGGLSATRDIEEIISLEVKKDQEDASDLGVEKEEVSHSLLGNDVEIKEVLTSDTQIIDPEVILKKSEHGSNEEHVEPQAISDDAKTHSDTDRDFPTEQAPKEQIEEVNADKSLTEEASEKQIIDPVVIIKKSEHESNEEHVEPQPISDDAKTHSDMDFPTEQAPKEQTEEVSADNSLIKETFEEKIQVPSLALQDNQDKSHTHVEETSFKAPEKDKETDEQQQKSNDLTYVQEDNGKNVKLEVHGDGDDSVVALNKETDLIEEKRELEYVKTELEEAIKDGVSVQENASENIDGKAEKKICQEESRQTETVAIKEEIREEEELSGESKEMPAEKKTEEQKETAQECMKNTDDAIHKTQPEILETGSLSSVSKTHNISKQEDEVPNQQKREIADEVLNPENLKNTEELQQKDGESEPTVKEPPRKSLSDLIQKVKATNETEDVTRESHVEEETKTEEEEDEHKEDKTSPDSIVMVEAKDTVSIIKTQKKSHGILSGVGSKVKHSISKVKKVLTGKSSHTSKPTSPE